MRKIPTIFVRDWKGDRSRVTDECNSECLWVFKGDAVATRKWDGTAVIIQSGELFCRFDAKRGKHPPPNFVAAQPDFDEETGHWPGWVPAESNPQYKWQRAAFEQLKLIQAVKDGTYEAVGPHFQENPEGIEKDILLPHGNHKYVGVPVTFAELKDWLNPLDIEGLVWHHPDGRMAKIKKKDFGLSRKLVVNA